MMSRRKQLKPMHLRNDEHDLCRESPSNHEGGESNDTGGAVVGSLQATDLSIPPKTNNTTDEGSKPTQPKASPNKSILSDLSCLIPDDNEYANQSEKKENRNECDPSLRQFSLNQNKRSTGRPRGRGRGRGHGTNNHNQIRTNRSASGSSRSNADSGITISDRIMHCRICSKPFKRQWSLQVHELIHHQAHDSIPENLALTLAPSDRRRLAAGRLKNRSLLKHVEGKNGFHGNSRNCEPVSNAANSPKQPPVTSEHNSDGENDEKNLEIACSLPSDLCLRDNVNGFQHTPMFGGITIPTIANFRELRHQVSLARRTCKYCGKVCFKPSDLQRHLMKHTGERPFSCSQCGRKFKAKRSLHYHQRASHGAIIELSPALEDKFAQTKKYKKMLMKNEDTNAIDGGNDNSSVDSVTGSEDASEGQKDYIKDISDLSDDNEELSSGLSDSGGEEKLKVEDGLNGVQESEFPEVSSIVKIENIGSVKSEEEKTESDNVPSSEELNAHVSALIPSVAMENDILKDDKTTLILSSSSSQNNEKHPVLNRYKINFRSEEVIASKLEGINTVTGEKVYLYKCHLCGKIYSVMSKLQNHLTVHMKRNKKQYSCAHCGEVFKFRGQWLVHSRTHKTKTHQESNSTQGNHSDDPTTQLPAELPQNEETLKAAGHAKFIETLSRLTGQNGISNDELLHKISPPIIQAMDMFSLYPSSLGLPNSENDYLYSYDFKSKFKQSYNCRYCGKYFDRPFSLQRHERMHTGIKPCYCKDCGRGFSEPRNLRHHIIRFHSDGSLHHLLRRNRCKVDNLPRGVSTSDSLNASDPSSGVPNLQDAGSETLEESVPSNAKASSIDYNQNHTDSQNFQKPVEGDSSGGEAVTVVIPTEVENTYSRAAPYYVAATWEKPNASKDKSPASEENKEIMTDPKRSLIGNRKRQRLLKVQQESSAEMDAASVDNDDFGNDQFAHSDNTKDQNTSKGDSNGRHQTRPLREERWQTRMTVASLLARERGIELQPRKGRSRSQTSATSQVKSRTCMDKRQVGKMSFACCFCNKLLESANDLAVHMDVHNGSWQ